MTTAPAVALPEFKAVVLEQRQTQNLEFAGVDPARYPGGQAELALVGNECFRAIVAAGRSIDGFIHTESRFRLTEPMPVDQVILTRGRIESFTDTPKGTRIHYRFDLQVHNRPAPSATIDIIGIQAGDGALKREPRSAAPPAPAPVPAAPAPAGAPGGPFPGYREVGKFKFQPGRVERYSRYVGNKVHVDPLFAQKLGLRAPVAQGFMEATIMLGEIAKAGPPKTLDMTVKFTRPCFWDDEVSIWLRERAPGTPVGLKIVNAAGKPTAEASVAALGR